MTADIYTSMVSAPTAGTRPWQTRLGFLLVLLLVLLTVSCSKSTLRKAHTCGNGLLEALEHCDDGNEVVEACEYGQIYCEVCAGDCSLQLGDVSYCGDNVVDRSNGESCDDGNTLADDGCSTECITEVVTPEPDDGTDDNTTEISPIETPATDEPITCNENNTVCFDEPGEHNYTVPVGVVALDVLMVGGGGYGGNQIGATGGGGAFAKAEVPVTAGEVLRFLVASGGTRRGHGAGASYLLRNDAPLLVAAGGGGGGSDGCSGCKQGGAGGAGGAERGQDGDDLHAGFNPYCTAASGGAGASTSAGGAGGTSTGTGQYPCPGLPGSRNVGGGSHGIWGTCKDGGAEFWRDGGGQGNGGGGGGGAGFFGGGGAGMIWTYCAGGGGGGSSFSDSANRSTLLIAGDRAAPGGPEFPNNAGHGGIRVERQGVDEVGRGNDGMVVIRLDD